MVDTKGNLNWGKVTATIFVILSVVLAIWVYQAKQDSEQAVESGKLDAQNAFQEGKKVGVEEAYTVNEALLDGAVVPMQELTELKEELNKTQIELETKTTEASVPLTSGYVEDDLKLGEVSFVVDNDDLSKLRDSELVYEGEDYDFEETVPIVLELGYSGKSTYDEDLRDKPGLICTTEPCIGYTYKISDAFPWEDVSLKDDLDFEFLGRSLKVIDADADEDKMTIVYGLETFLNAGDSVQFEGKTLTLVQASDDHVVISVDGVREVIEEDDDERVNGLDIFVEAVVNEEGINFDSAKLFLSKASDDARDTINDGDRFIGEDKDDPNWRWVVSLDEAGASTIGVVYDKDMQDADDEGTLTLGESLCLPYEYVCFTFEQTEGQESKDYTADFRTEDIEDLATKVIKFDGRFEENNDAVYFDGVKFYEKEDGDFVVIGTEVTFDDSEGMLLKYEGGKLKVGDFLEFEADIDAKQWTLAETTEGVNLDTAEDDLLTADGIVVKAPEDIVSDNDEKLRFSVPEEELEYSLVFN